MIWVFFQHMYVIHLHRLKKTTFWIWTLHLAVTTTRVFVLFDMSNNWWQHFRPLGTLHFAARTPLWPDLTWPDLLYFLVSSVVAEWGGGRRWGEHYGRINKVDFVRMVVEIREFGCHILVVWKSWRLAWHWVGFMGPTRCVLKICQFVH